MINKEGKVEKGWGYELIWASNDQYCGKIMVFERKGAKFSMHFHKTKDETWFVNEGKFLLSWIDTKTATLLTKELKEATESVQVDVTKITTDMLNKVNQIKAQSKFLIK